MPGLSQIQMIAAAAAVLIIIVLGVLLKVAYSDLDAEKAKVEARDAQIAQLNDQVTVALDKNAGLTSQIKQLTADAVEYKHSAEIAHQALLNFQSAAADTLKGNQDAIDQGATADDDKPSGAFIALGRRVRGQAGPGPAPAHRP